MARQLTHFDSPNKKIYLLIVNKIFHCLLIIFIILLLQIFYLVYKELTRRSTSEDEEKDLAIFIFLTITNTRK